MFRLRDSETGFWYESMDDGGDITWVSNKAEALIFPPEKREFWEGDENIEIIPLEVDEVMAQMGAPRLPGF